MKPAMYLFVNSSLNMSAGKMAAQIAHAAVRAYRISDKKLSEYWLNNGECKLVMIARDEDEIYRIQEYLNAKNIKAYVIFDEGLTELEGIEVTALGVEVVDREIDEVQNAFGHFQLFRPKIKVNLEVEC